MEKEKNNLYINSSGKISKTAKSKNTRTLLIILTAAVFLLCTLLIVYMFYEKNSGESRDMGNGLSLAENAEEWNKTLENAGGAATGIKVPGYGDIYISENSQSANIALVNPEGNPCYFQYDLKIGDTVLYSSDLIEPGKAVKEISLNNVPVPGTYELVMAIKTYSFDENLSPMNGAEVKTTLVVT